jgi:hypothetical protein
MNPASASKVAVLPQNRGQKQRSENCICLYLKKLCFDPDFSLIIVAGVMALAALKGYVALLHDINIAHQ